MTIQRTNKRSHASQLNHPIWIQDKFLTPDGEGSFYESWNDRKPFTWGAVYPIKESERLEYRTKNVHVTHHIKIRGKVEISDRINRLRFRDRYFEILSAVDFQERGVITLVTALEIRDGQNTDVR